MTALADAEHPVTRWMDLKLQAILTTRRRESEWFAALSNAIRRRTDAGAGEIGLDRKLIDAILDTDIPQIVADDPDSVVRRDSELKKRSFLGALTSRSASVAAAARLERELKGAVEDVLPQLPSDLHDEFELLDTPRSHLRRIGQLANRVRTVLRPGDANGSGTEFVIERGYNDLEKPPSGVLLYRPVDLDELRDLTYLQLRFHSRVHWASYLSAVSLINSHPQALWKLVSSLLSSANPAARADAQRLVTGPDSMLTGFRHQLRALSAPAVAELTIDVRDEPGPAKGEPRRFAWLRLESSVPGATIPEQRSRVQRASFERALEDLEALLAKEMLEPSDHRAFAWASAALGEDVFQELADALERIEKEAERSNSDLAGQEREPPHLQIQLPRELTRYPWELLHLDSAELGDRFAVARAAFVEAGVARPSSVRAPGPLRVLIVGDPLLDEKQKGVVQLPGARSEATAIAEEVERHARESAATIDFDRDRDVFIGRTMTGKHLRAMLRQGTYDIVHFSGHATFDKSEPGSSAWMLSDGPLTALQIRTTLRKSTSPPWLVYANACQSSMEVAKGDEYPRDIFGLATAFINAGVAAYVGSLWPIDDFIAASMGIKFHQSLLRGRRTLGAALWDAKRVAKDIVLDPPEGLGAPRIWNPLAAGVGLGWASLIMYGDPTATVAQLLGPRTKPPK